MCNYKIIGDSCCDYTDDVNLDFLIRVPLTVELGDMRYPDDGTLDCDRLLADMAKSDKAPASACPAPAAFAAAIGEAPDAYIVTLSEKVSGTYNSAVLGADAARAENPALNVHVFNSLSAAAGEIAVCCKIKALLDQGMSFAEVVDKTETYVKHLTTFFVLETLDVFRKNGRLSHLQALATAALKIRLIMGADENGAIVMRGKALTMQRALKGLVEQIKARYAELDDAGHEILYITHCACRERAESLRDAILAACPAVKKVVICKAGGLSTMYANAGGIIVGF
ncbi:MAG: DegV family protein [Clostridia bacterium]|nr:DegV family protein [Clostridia bacterium]